ncbi:MAG: calcium-translocating P-type ATPase, PMCA-type [Bacteroidales bacterium]|nr:calcium-translocating P-type ATPase, PMCA-type [Bacteroidales bacterium]
MITNYQGLSDKEVLESRAKHGENILTPAKKTPLWKKFLEKFKDPMIIVLLIAGALSIAISFYEYFSGAKGFSVFFEPVGIFVAIFLATGLAFIFELRADRQFEVLNKVNDDEIVKVIRNGKTTEITKKDVVVGDIVKITNGDEVPADAELLESSSLKIDESSLTGEPICEKTTVEADFDKEATFASNHVMKGTKVMEGHGICRVFAVGDNTENGKVFTAAQIDSSVRTPLNEQLDKLGSLVSKLGYAIAGLIIVGRLLLYFTSDAPFELMGFLSYLLQTAMIAVTLIVVSVPEGLPMAVTLALAYSMQKMLKTNNLVRKMHACETMGATSVICTDKTGTLTQNQMTIYQTKFFSLSEQKIGEDKYSNLIKEGIAVNSTASLDLTDEKPKVIGNPTEGALLLWLRENGVDYSPLKRSVDVKEEIPFSTERKFMATLVYSPLMQKDVLYVKGAPEIVHAMCCSTCEGVSKEEIDATLLEYQSQAMRTLGFAYKIVEEGEKVIENGKIVANGLEFLGIVAISDPVRKEVPAAIRDCISAGINIKIVTGDTTGTAKEIGRQVGLWTSEDGEKNIITGPEFAALSDEELRERILDFKIISRARPMDKKRLVETLQELGQVVAVTGDGTNDAPALKAAHVGLSMGDGTSVAKEASDITIIDSSFESIGRAVMWGRSLYQNIQRFILFQMTVNVAACFIVLVGAFMGTESPLTVTQMLWVNLIMDTFAAMALASLPPTEKVMKDKPRNRTDFIINKFMRGAIIGTGALFFAGLFVLLWVFQHVDIHSLSELCTQTFTNDGHLNRYEESLFFTIFVMLQFWNMFNARAYKTGRSAFNFKDCESFGLIALIIVLGQVLIVSFGGEMFNVTPLSWQDWLIVIGGTSIVLWIGEIGRLINRLKRK